MRARFQWWPRAAVSSLCLSLFVAVVTLQGQGGQDEPPPRRVNQSTDPLLAPFTFRSIGPASMGGRVDDVALAETDSSIIYIGYAVGGVFKSVNNGTTFEPVFDTYGTGSIGDIAIHPTNPNIVYVGTGEANNRQTSSFGDGIYKTVDGGRTFAHIGLKETQTIARIVIDPRAPETLYVASPGHLFGPNPERGIYKTTDGGKTWSLIKFIDQDTGFTDIAIDPSNSNILYAASYQRRRSGCCFNGGGPGSGLWKTQDAGKTWTSLTGNGLPPGTYGRIALDVARSNPNVVYAQIQAGEVGLLPTGAPQPVVSTEATPSGPAAVGGQAPAPAGAARGPAFNWCNNAGPGGGFPAGRAGGGGRGPQGAPAGPPQAPALNPRVGGIVRSEDKGRTWTLVSNCNARPMYFSQIRVDPTNDRAVYVAGLPVAKSLDGGKTFVTLDAAGGHSSPGHVDQHAIWIDPRNPRHLVIGNDGGLDVSWDQGHTWDSVKTMATATAYVVSADMRRPYYVYIGLQDNGSWGGPSATRNDDIRNSDWFRIGGGDGFYTAADPTDFNIVYSESQDGGTQRYDLRTGSVRNIRPVGRGGGRGGPATAGLAPPAPNAAGQPAAPAGQAQPGAPGAAGPPAGGRGGAQAAPSNVVNAGAGDVYRFNWNTPFLLSPHNPSIVWLGGNRLFRSYNRGDTWVASPDLTKQIDRNTVSMLGVPGDRTMLSKHDGVVAYSTIISVAESPVVPGVVWAGTDDGLVQVSRDGGVTFSEVGRNLPGLPANHLHWISRIEASHFDAGTAYVAVDGHRSDDLKPYVFVTSDYGQTFRSITGNLPSSGNVLVVREDPKNRNLLFVGTEFGLYVSLDGGLAWKPFMTNYPTVRTDDILVHPRDGDLIVATHGRSVLIADDITPLQQLTPDLLAQDAALFDVRPAVAYLTDRRRAQFVAGQKVFEGENPPRGTMIAYYLKAAATGDVTLSIADATGRTIRTMDGTKDAGINRVLWNLTAGGGRGGGGGGGGGGGAIGPGTYVVSLSVGGKTFTKPIVVLADQWMAER